MYTHIRPDNLTFIFENKKHYKKPLISEYIFNKRYLFSIPILSFIYIYFILKIYYSLFISIIKSISFFIYIIRIYFLNIIFSNY